MKILFAISSPITVILLKGQTAYNKSMGAQVYLATSFDENIAFYEESEGFIFKKINLIREISILKDITAIVRAIKILKEVKPDIINASTPKAGFIFMIAALFVKSSYPVFTLRGLRSDSLSGFKKKVVWCTEFITCFLANKVIVISPSLRDHVVASKIVKKSKTIVIGRGSSNGINIAKFTNTPDKINSVIELKKQWGIPPKSFVYGFIGRIVKDKGIVEMYLAFMEVKKNNNNVYLLLAGEIENDNSVSLEILNKMRADTQVRFIGFSNDIPSVISAFDVLILFSYREGFGNASLEASSMGKPVLVSDIPGLRDTVLDNITGYIIQSKNYIELANKMNLYLYDPYLRCKHGNDGRVRVVKYFSSNFIWEELYKLYETLITKT